MDNWPLAADYTLMLQNPQIAFKDKELQRATFRSDAHNLPFGMSGAFAVVYHARMPNGDQKAVRAFTSPSDDRAARYAAISDYLTSLTSLKSLVNFRYTDKGVRSTNGKLYPLLTMDWVAGDTLYNWADVKARDRNVKALRSSCDRWLDLIGELRNNRIAHGDLQHGNVLVMGNGDLKLVDYDCMCVPKLVGLPNLEIGVEPYQHRDRGAATRLTPDLDNFSSLVIFVALRSLAESPDLWRTYVAADRYEKLLFRRSDFEQPKQSPLLGKLTSSRDADLARMVSDLCGIYQGRIDDVPTLDDFLFSYEKVRSLLSQRMYDEAIALVQRRPGKKAIPADLKQPLNDAELRVQCRLKLKQCVDLGDEVGMAKHYQPQLLNDYPAAKELVDIAKDAPQVVRLDDKMRQLLANNKVRDLVSVWDQHPVLQSRKSMAKRSEEVLKWRKCNQACDEFLQVLPQQQDKPGGTVKKWEQLKLLGGHPEAAVHRQSMELLSSRWQSWLVVDAIPTNLDESTDKALMSAWNEKLFNGWPFAEKQRIRLTKAQARLRTLNQLTKLLKSPESLAIEQGVQQLAQTLPKGYQHSASNRVTESTHRVQAFGALLNALKEPISDLQLVAAWKKLCDLKSQALVDARVRERIALAERRAPLIERIRRISLAPSADVDKALVSSWDPELLENCHDVQPWVERFKTAKQRKGALKRLERAISAKDDDSIDEIAKDESLQSYTLPPTWKRAIAEARERSLRVKTLLKVIETHDLEHFRETFDAPLIRKYERQFKPHFNHLVEWVKHEVLTSSGIGLAPSFATASVTSIDESGTSWRLRWSWPLPRFSDLCYIGISEKPPGVKFDDRTARLRFREPVSRESYESAGGSRIIHTSSEMIGCFVFVWAVVDLGQVKLCSEPVVLGKTERPENATRPKTWFF